MMKKRNPVAAALKNATLHLRVVRPRKGKGSYDRKRKESDCG